jgi:histone H3/H4
MTETKNIFKSLPLNPIRRILHKADYQVRISDMAVEETRLHLEDYAHRVGAKATLIAFHANRNTVRAEDIEKAVKEVPFNKN